MQESFRSARAHASPDPFLTLSNMRLDNNYTSNKKQTNDRFLNELSAIKCKLNFDAPPDNTPTDT